jgi:transcriptional regulator with XRE-family HTH domain
MQQKEIFNLAYQRLVTRLHHARLNKGMILQTAAAKVGKRASWLSKVERYELRLDVLTFVHLARTYGLRAGKLVAKLEEELSSEGDDPSSLHIALCTPVILVGFIYVIGGSFRRRRRAFLSLPVIACRNLSYRTA